MDAEAGMWYDALMAVSSLIDEETGQSCFSQTAGGFAGTGGIIGRGQYDSQPERTG